MAWESRGGDGRYYYSARWEGGRVVKTYHGRGPLAEQAAALVREARLRKAEAAAALRQERARLAGPEKALRALDEVCTLLMAATLTAAGFHRQNFSAWRRRRVRTPHTA